VRMVEGQVSRVESQKLRFGRRSSSGPRPSSLDSRPSRSGVTLVELLITILIISILAALILGVAAVAGETARESHTRNIITRLHTLLAEYYGTYKDRRVQIRQPIIDGINASTQPGYRTSAEKGRARAYARLYALRELMLMEVPDRWSDVLLNAVPADPTGLADARYPFYQDMRGNSPTGRTSLANIYLRRYTAIANLKNSLTGNFNTREEILNNQGAECLYMVITLATGDGEARSQFGARDIGDTDGDGALEFLDAWGKPIEFLRWAPGFDSSIQINANQFLPLPVNDAWKSVAATDHDPFDIFRTDPPAFRLEPLIFAAGRDELLGIRTVNSYVVYQGLTQPLLSRVPNLPTWPAILPWAQVDDPDLPGKVFLGTNMAEGAADNVHNHLLGQR
jgi:prepilin-type N-terminal cleavage/methylation domain-containing protein